MIIKWEKEQKKHQSEGREAKVEVWKEEGSEVDANLWKYKSKMVWKQDVSLSISGWQSKKSNHLFWSWICSLSRAWLNVVSLGSTWEGSWITWKLVSSPLSGGWHWLMAPTWNTYTWSHVLSPLHGMVTRFRKSACQEKLADAAWPFLIKPQKFHSITFAVLRLRQWLSPPFI